MGGELRIVFDKLTAAAPAEWFAFRPSVPTGCGALKAVPVTTNRPLTSMSFARLLLFAALLLPLTVRPAEDWFLGTFTGKEMLTACRAVGVDSVNDFERGICRGFVEGFVAGRYVGDTSHALHHRDEKFDQIPGRLCIPKDINKVALAIVFVQYLDKNPDKQAWNAGLLLEAALQESFPCPK
jgi:hypothetical protein